MDVVTLADLHHGAAEAYLPQRLSKGALHDAVQDCRGCPLWEHATQGVIGEGLKSAPIMLVGEQPGDREDVEGRPFVGPAGALLDRALEEAGIDRQAAYVTNAVKHFKWEPRGKRRLHQRPNRGEVDACGPWLASEIEYVRPDFLVLLGSTAAQAVLGSDVRVTRIRGEVFTDTGLARRVMATVHPSSILRARGDEARRHQAMAEFVEDLRQVTRSQVVR
jgi:DNA polymerase